MSDRPHQPETLDAEQQDEAPELPRVFSMKFTEPGEEMLEGAVIVSGCVPEGTDIVNIAAAYHTQLVLARTDDDLQSRVISVLIANYGLTQEDAETAFGDTVYMQPVASSGRRKRKGAHKEEAERKAQADAKQKAEAEEKAREAARATTATPRPGAQAPATHSTAQTASRPAQQTHTPPPKR